MAAARTDNARDSVLNADINSFGHGISKPHKLIFVYIGSLKRAAFTRRAKELPRDDPRRMAFLASADCKYSNQLLQGKPIEALRFTAREFRSAVQNKSGVPQSRCLPPITNHAKNTPLRVDVYGYFLKTVTGAKYGGIRQLQDPIDDLLSRWLKARARSSQRWRVGQPPYLQSNPLRADQLAERQRQRQQSMAAGDHPRPDHQCFLPGAPRRRSVCALWGRHYPRGFQGAGTRGRPTPSRHPRPSVHPSRSARARYTETSTPNTSTSSTTL